MNNIEIKGRIYDQFIREKVTTLLLEIPQRSEYIHTKIQVSGFGEFKRQLDNYCIDDILHVKGFLRSEVYKNALRYEVIVEEVIEHEN